MFSKRIVLLLLILPLFLLACSADQITPTETAPVAQTSTPAPAVEEATATPTAAPAATAQPEPTAAPSAGEVQMTDVQYILANNEVNILNAPLADGAVLGFVAGGQIAQVTGVSSDGLWWRVICPDDSVGDCWVTADPAQTQPTTDAGEGGLPIDPTALVEIELAPASGEQPLLPPQIGQLGVNGGFPKDMQWQLATTLPEGPAELSALAQPPVENLTIKTAEAAGNIAAHYGFTQGLSVEWRPDLSEADASATGLFVAFDGTRTLSIGIDSTYYSDVAHWKGSLPYEQAAPIAEKFLLDNGYLTFTYQMAQSDQGQGVLFFPLVDGAPTATPAFAVQIGADGQVGTMQIYELNTLRRLGYYPLISAADAWQQIQADPNSADTFYAFYPPQSNVVPEPAPFYQRPTLTAGSEIDLYTNIWVHRTLGTGEIRVSSSEFFRIEGSEAMLNELAQQMNNVVHLFGTVREDVSGVFTLALDRWEFSADMGSLPWFFGTIDKSGSETRLIDTNGDTYVLPKAPADLADGATVQVRGVEDGDQLIWQELTVEVATPASPELPAMQTVTINEVSLQRQIVPHFFSGLGETVSIPVWVFKGMADNGEQVVFWKTAVLPEYINK